jgi:flagellar hook assembly protein FlgD
VTFCEVLSQTDCTGYGGVFMGNGTLCEPNPCVSGVEDAAQVTSLHLSATPNPSTGQVVIRYTLPKPMAVTIEVFDAAGALVRRLEEGQRQAGAFSTPWDGRDDNGRQLPTGVYFTRIMTGQGSAMGRAVIAR